MWMPNIRGISLALTLVGLTTGGLSAAQSTAIRAEAEIVEVTVYRDRAEVVKEATVTLPVGESSVEFPNLPFGVDRDTLRVSASGVPVTLGAIALKEHAEEPKATPEWVAAQADVRRLEEEIAMLETRRAVDIELTGFLKAVGEVTAKGQARELGEGRGDPAAIGAVYGLLEEKLGALGQADLERQGRRRDLAEDLTVAQARLATLRPARAIRSRLAVVEIESRAAGRLTVRLAYLAPGASWRPSYRATLDAGTGDVALIAEGVVRQSTGEPWAAVRLKLSTASPAAGIEPPHLDSWILRPARFAEGAQAVGREVTADERFYQSSIQLAPKVAPEEDGRTEPAAHSQAQIVRSAYNVAFGVPGRSNVPSDGGDHRVVLRQEILKANLVHRTVPGLEDRAYLTAVTTSPGDYPLLAGPVRVFAAGAYLGSFALEETGPGSELTLPFGVDNRIEIVRVPEPSMESRGGLTGKNRLVERSRRTLIHNLLDREVTLTLEERLPVSEDERVRVVLGAETTAGFRDSPRRPGVKLWTLTLAAGEKRELRFDYSVRYPRELRFPDLEG